MNSLPCCAPIAKIKTNCCRKSPKAGGNEFGIVSVGNTPRQCWECYVHATTCC